MRILFCNIAWMKYYVGTCEQDIPQRGGSYVDEHRDANESSNFLPVTIEQSDMFEKNASYCFGSFETKCTNRKNANQVHIENIWGCGHLKSEAYADKVLVVWCASSCKNESVVVGWYKNATVFREYQIIELDDNDERIFNITAKTDDCVLLPEEERYNPIWAVPRVNQKGKAFGFGQANVWYATDKNAEEYIKNLASKIEQYAGENWITKEE